MNILFLSQLLPFPLDAGPKVRSYYVLRQLALTHHVTLLAFTRESDTQESIDHLKTFCETVITIPVKRSRFNNIWALLLSWVSGQPFLITRDQSRQMTEAIGRITRQQDFDFVHADQLWMAKYALKAKSELMKRGIPPRLVLDQHNAVFQIPERMAENTDHWIARQLLRGESGVMAEFETDICQKFDDVVWVTQEDLHAVTSHASREASDKIQEISRVIPICVEPQGRHSDGLSTSRDILFLGGMHWPPNAEGIVWFCKNVFPSIHKLLPDVKLLAIGKSPPKSICDMDGVEAPGYVDHTEPYWRKARVFVVPLLSGGGMRVKILDAWAHGVPVISTSIGAEGMRYQDGQDILISDQPEKMIEQVIHLLNQSDRATQISNAGLAALEKYYDWRVVYKDWDHIYHVKNS